MRVREVAIPVLAALIGALVSTLLRPAPGTTGPAADATDDAVALKERIVELERILASRGSAPLAAAPRAEPAPASDTSGSGAVPTVPKPSDRATGSAGDARPSSPSLQDLAVENTRFLHFMNKVREELARPPPTPDEIRRLLDSGRREDLHAALQDISRTRDRSFLPTLVELVHRPERKEDAPQLIGTIANLKDRSWSALQATGAPDTPIDGDLGTAWASKQQEMGLVTLDLEYDRSVRVDGVRIHETLHPGAVAKVLARAPDGTWDTIWEGEARREPSPNWFEPPIHATTFATNAIRLVIDTDRVPGWNEIDAVELVGDGLRQWASRATASSSYSD